MAKAIDANLVPPSGPNSSSYGEHFLNAETGALVSVADCEIYIPAGFDVLIVQPRSCGDFYAELSGKNKSFARIGDSTLNAVIAVSTAAEQVSA